MDNVTNRTETKAYKWGWGMLVVASTLLVINGVTWFFMGPTLSWVEGMGVPLEEFRQTYPIIADNIATSARQVALWFVAFGMLALLVALEGFRHSSRWAWNASWILVSLLVAIGALYRTSFGVIYFGLAAVVLVGQMLTRTGSR